MRTFVAHLLKGLSVVVGLALVVAGLVLWVTPIVPGLGLVFVGLPMVMGAHPRGRALAVRWKHRARVRGRVLRRRLRRCLRRPR